MARQLGSHECDMGRTTHGRVVDRSVPNEVRIVQDGAQYDGEPSDVTSGKTGEPRRRLRTS